MKLWILVFLLAITSTSLAQQTSLVADTAYIYKGFKQGGSTNSISNHSHKLDTMANVQKVMLTKEALDTLNFLLGQARPKKHFQQKIGPSFYAEIVKNGSKHRIAIISEWAIIDLTTKRQYVFRDTPYADIFNRFVNAQYR